MINLDTRVLVIIRAADKGDVEDIKASSMERDLYFGARKPDSSLPRKERVEMKEWMTGIITLAILALVLPGPAVAQEAVACAHTYIVQPGDWLANIAARYYDNPWAYPIIVFATNSAVHHKDGFQTISDPNLIEPGWKLCIPDAETAMGAVGVDTLKNIVYQSDWTKEGTAPLVDGTYSEPGADGSATKTVVKLHDRMAFGYAAGGQQLAVAVLVTDPGGSGTFYDLAALVFEDGGPQHVASALLGDRVQIQSLALENGEIVVKMMTQGPDDPMCCPKQRVVERYALQGEELVQVSSEVVADASDIVGVTWQWQSTQTPVEKTTIDDPAHYTLRLESGGEVYVQADCNRLRGTYTLTDMHITIALTTSTRAACPPDSLDDRFIKELSAAVIYFTEGEELFLDLQYDSGTMRFARSDDKELAFTYDFDRDAEGWVTGFADLPADYEDELYQLDSGHRELPSELGGSGIYIQGHNSSDDLFMFLKKKVDGLKPETSYLVTFRIDLATNVAEGMMGIGGSPGESVYVKAGATEVEPLVAEDASDYLRMNIDKGNQAQEGKDMINLGNVAHPELGESGTEKYKIKSLDNEGRAFQVTTDADGGLWFIVGTDSGFEGLTALYYSNISISLQESSTR